MRVIRHLDTGRPEIRRSVVTLGNFDGVHAGHGEILRRVVESAREREAEAVAMTFFPHPAAVLAPGRASPPIASLGDRLARFRDAGIGTVAVQHFTREFSRVTAETFVDRYLLDVLGAEKVVIGHNVNFGHGRRGDAALLREMASEREFEVEVVGPIVVDGTPVSSTEIRRCLAEGDVRRAARLLGRPYGVEGGVVTGAKRGKGLGFPTANVRPSVEPLVPDGVYAVRVRRGREGLDGVANIGHNPTFGGTAPRAVEVHLFDFDEDLYGERLRVSLVERLRGEVRFPSVDALVQQIRQDAARAREILAAERS